MEAVPCLPGDRKKKLMDLTISGKKSQFQLNMKDNFSGGKVLWIEFPLESLFR